MDIEKVVSDTPSDDIVLCNHGAECPPHRMPHSIPFIGKLKTDEPCHFYKSSTTMEFHRPHCHLLECPHTNSMINAHLRYVEDHKNRSR